MKALLAPSNFANQPALLARALRERGVDASHLLYAWTGRNAYGFDRDRVVQLDRGDWLRVQLEVVSEVVDARLDIVHLWHRSLVSPPGGFGFFSGLDLPYLKASGARIVYRFTGYDLRVPSVDRAVNPYSPLNHGFAPPSDEDVQRRYLEHLRQWVDAFVVQDPEMAAFLPEAEVIPRGVDLSTFEYVGTSRKHRPLVVHAPSSPLLKGTDAVVRAVDELRARGLDFEFQLIEKMTHREAADWYRQADIVVDQLRIGWYGVLAVEAMALGKPVVAYIRPELAEQFERPMPVLYATVDDITARLETLIRDADMRAALGREGREFAEEVHDIRKVAARVEELYRRVVEVPEASAASVAPHFMTALSDDVLATFDDARLHRRVKDELGELRMKARTARGAEWPARRGRRRWALALRLLLPVRVAALERRVRRAVRLLRRDPAGFGRLAAGRVRRRARGALVRQAPPVGAGSDSDGGLSVCILSRKDLGRVTRVVRQADALARAGHHVTVVSLKRPAQELVATTPTVDYLEVALDPWTRRAMIRLRRWSTRRRADAAPATGARPSLDPVRYAPRLARTFAQSAATRSFAQKAAEALDGRTFAVYQAHDNFALVAADRLARRSGAALVYDAVEISEHRYLAQNGPLDRVVQRLERREEARILRGASAMITIGDGLADWYARRYRIKRPLPVRNCRWYWPYERRDDIRRDCALGPDDRLVVWFGYIYPMQGVEALVAAVAATPAHLHFALLAPVIASWERFLASVREQVDALGVAGRCHFLPPREPNELISYVSGADVGIIPRPNAGPNIYYSMPNKLLEMVMARLPVAVSDLHDIRRLVERHDIGAVFDVDHPASIAGALAGMLEPAEHERLRANVMAAAQVLCWENESRPYVELFARKGPLAHRS